MNRPHLTTIRIASVIAAVGLLLAACASAPAGVQAPSSAAPSRGAAATASSTSSAPPPAAQINMCALMPLGDVQANSPFTTALATAKSTAAITGCQYDAALGSQDPVNALLVITTFDSAQDALAAMANDRQAAADQDVPLGDVAGVGQAGYWAGSDIVGVHAVVGAQAIDANFKGEWPDTPDTAKVSSGTNLIRLVIARLP